MKLGYIGLGKMGKNMVLHLLEKKWDILAYNRSPEARRIVSQKGAVCTDDLREFMQQLKSPRLIWIMVPYKAVDDVLRGISRYLKKGDTVIDGGNSPYLDSIRRAKNLKKRGVYYLDAGVSGGPGGARKGACIMVGGEKRIYKKFEKLFKDATVKKGYGYMGASGSGHFVKMVHNGIEYGMMQAIAEGFEVLKKSPFKLKMLDVTGVYRHGSVITSRLVDWLENAYKEHGDNLKGISGKVAHSGEGLWTVKAAKKLRVPVANIEQALRYRVQSQKKPSYTGQVLTALRSQFGGHSKKGDK